LLDASVGRGGSEHARRQHALLEEVGEAVEPGLGDEDTSQHDGLDLDDDDVHQEDGAVAVDDQVRPQRDAANEGHDQGGNLSVGATVHSRSSVRSVQEWAYAHLADLLVDVRVL